MLVLRPGALGDTLLALPALRALRRSYPSITLGAHGGAARLLAALGEVERGLAFDDPSLGWIFGDRLGDEPVVAWMNAATAPALSHAAVVAAARPSSEQHCAEYLLATLAPLGIYGELDVTPLGVAAEVSDEVLVHPGSGAAAKNWPAARFAATIGLLKSPVRLIVGEADTRAAAEVEAALGHPLPHLEHASLEELAAGLAGCRAYLGNDSGVSHLAGLCGARAVVLFGPTSPEIWRPLGPHVHVESFHAAVADIASLLSG
jgi:heptosyltransferase-3